ncbi:thermonuclease family protein [Methylocystis sp.]|uniref:thermonuclease family protein n=1 Tax=Methylocystis sp. TaxID=1911079 RepID=UPI0025FE2904|nr:thermonuclease family protein [Methylocystis sp.]
MRFTTISILGLAALWAFGAAGPGHAFAGEIAGRASVIDADTIEIHGRRIRLHGVDAPERGQPCFMPNGAPWRCGQEGALALSDFLGATVVSCVGVDTDRYGRMVADCTANDRDISAWLVSEGWAMAYRRYSTAHVEAEEAARNARRGIWAGTVQPPWEWRLQRTH